MSTETTLAPVTFVRDMTDPAVFTPQSENKLWQTEQGDFILTSYAKADCPVHEFHAETIAYRSEENGEPSNPAVYFSNPEGDVATVEDAEPNHVGALEALGYRVAE